MIARAIGRQVEANMSTFARCLSHFLSPGTLLSSRYGVNGINIPHDSRPYITMALTRQVSPRITDALTSSSSPISLVLAEKQRTDYVLCLKRLLPAVKDLPALDEYPDCCFVEDTVVVIGSTALLMNMGDESRQGEVESIKSVLEKLPGITKVQDMRDMSDTAMCDGGDVLWTGRHVFVGLSQRTNQQGVEVIRQVFPMWEVIAVPVTKALHLKSLVTHMDRHTLVAPNGPLGDALLQDMQAAERGYEVVRLSNILACNVVAINGTIIAQDCPQSKQMLQEAAEENNLNIEFVDTSELAKVDAALTCCSILLDVK